MEYILNKGKAMAVVSELGGEMTSFRIGDLLYTWTGDARYWAGKAPVLFPVVCALKNDTITFGGKTYNIEKHGFARRSGFSVLEKGDGHIVFGLTESDNSMEKFPFRFLLKITHTLLENGFKTEYAVINRGDRDMVFCIGGHPAFRVPLNEGEDFSDYSLVFEKDEVPYAYYTENGLMDRRLVKKLDMKDSKVLPLNHEDFDDDALIFTNLNSEKVSILRYGRGLEFSFAGFPVLGVWSPPHKAAPFVCLEPWYGLPAYTDEDGSFESKPYAVTLAPGKTFHTCYGMRAVY